MILQTGSWIKDCIKTVLYLSICLFFKLIIIFVDCNTCNCNTFRHCFCCYCSTVTCHFATVLLRKLNSAVMGPYLLFMAKLIFI